MKKIIILLLTLSMLLRGSTACSKKKPDSSQGGANSGENNIYSTLNDLSKKEYDSIKVDIKTSSDFAKLYSTYTLNDKHVIYSSLFSLLKINKIPLTVKFIVESGKNALKAQGFKAFLC